MAGSIMHQPNQDIHDPILSARLEALQLLAAQVSEPIVIFTPSFELVYANESARKLQTECPLLYPDETKSFPSSSSTESCPDCPGKHVFSQASCESSTPGIGGDGNQPSQLLNCPFPKAFLLLGSDEGSGCVLMMGNNGRESCIAPMVEKEEANPGVWPSTQKPKGIDELIGNSSAMEQVAELIQIVASSGAPVLVQGESGTGKEVVARSIHRLSFRRDQPFVVVDCGSLPETLLESELFGHVKGSFTGAMFDRKGLFEEAEGGTLFLDEIADTTSTFQAKLLRVLQEGEVKPVGSNRSKKVDVRIISATNKPLEELVKRKAFRADLYYRLAVLPIYLAPLRDRREDIPLLIDHFIKQACLKNGKLQLSVDPDVYQVLMEKSWPGNVRELEHLIERIVLTSRASRLTRDDVDISGNSHLGHDLPTTGRMARVHAEKLRILYALAQTKGNKTLAAKILNISRASLYNKLRDYHIS